MTPFKNKKSKINRNYSKLHDEDVELLNRLINRFENEKLLVVLQNEKFYSKETIENYMKLGESIKRLHDIIDVHTDKLPKMIPESW